MEFIIKKTTELSKKEVSSILYIFKEVFEKERTEEFFFNQFSNTPLGYSWHILMYDDADVIGTHTYVPAYFNMDGKRLLFVSGADTMILKGHRDIFVYMDMLRFGRKFLKENGVSVDYGYPNDLNFKIFMKSKLSKEIDNMNIYCLPYRIGGIKRGLGFLNWVSMLFCWAWVGMSYAFASKKVTKFRIAKDLLTYNEGRYKRADGNYNKQEGFVYKVMDYEGIRAGFLIDVFEKSPKNFCKAVRYMLKHDGKNFDILLYPGYLPFVCNGMIKLPRKAEPKQFHMICKIINEEGYDTEALYDIRNWDTNLSNYDLI